MVDRVHFPPNLIFSVGTQIVTTVDLATANGAIPSGSVGVVVRAPEDLTHAYRIRFVDGAEASVHRDQLTMLAHHAEGGLGEPPSCDLFARVIFRCVIGSQAYGLANEDSDVDRRGIFLPSARQHWSLFGVPQQVENHATQEAYWEIQKFLVLALKANPNVLECLYTPMVETATPLAQKLLAMRSCFLSKLAHQTYNGYVLSQFAKMQADVRNSGAAKPKHVMHLIRLLLSGIGILRHGVVPVRVEEHRDELLAIRRGEMAWADVEAWRERLHHEFDDAARSTTLPDRPDYARADAFLIEARQAAVAEELP
jgi:uncharacterized protein